VTALVRARLALVGALVVCLAAVHCAAPEDPARVRLRARLGDERPLTADELKGMIIEVGHTLVGKRLRLDEGSGPRDLQGEERETVFGMLTDSVGVFDEGLREDKGKRYRILNAPGVSMNSEIEAARRLWVDVQTLEPVRFDFAYAFPGYGDYSLAIGVN
jgi:hypothetical protein